MFCRVNLAILMACTRGVKGWKTLTLWVYHPNPQRLYRLATMEVKGETSKSVAQFWTIFNEMLSEIKKEPG